MSSLFMTKFPLFLSEFKDDRIAEMRKSDGRRKSTRASAPPLRFLDTAAAKKAGKKVQKKVKVHEALSDKENTGENYRAKNKPAGKEGSKGVGGDASASSRAATTKPRVKVFDDFKGSNETAAMFKEGDSAMYFYYEIIGAPGKWFTGSVLRPTEATSRNGEMKFRFDSDGGTIFIPAAHVADRSRLIKL